MTFTETDHFELRDDLVVEEIDDDIVVLDLEGNKYFGLNEVGWMIWRDIQEDRSFGEIVDGIVEEFDVDEEIARDDAAVFIDQLLDAGLANRGGGEG